MAPLITVGANCHSSASFVAVSHRSSRAAGTSPVADARSSTVRLDASASLGVSDGSPASATKLVGRVWMAAIAFPIEVGEDAAGPQIGQRDRRPVHVVVDHHAAAVDRRLPGVRRHAERQSRAHSGAERLQRDQVGGLLDLRPFGERASDDPVRPVPIGEQRGVEFARARRADRAGAHDVQSGYGRSRQRG